MGREETDWTANGGAGLFLSVIEHLPLGVHVYRLEPGGRLVFAGANPAADRILGVDNGQFVGKTIEEAFPPLAATEIPDRYRRAAAGEHWETEQIAYEDDRIVGAFNVQAFRIGPDLMAATFQDITERKRSEDRLRESEALYHDLVETAQDLIWQVDAEGRYTYLNPAWEEVFGYRLEEMLGRRFTDFQTPEWAERDRGEFARLLAGGVVKGLETVHVAKDGRPVRLLFNAKTLTDGAGRPCGTRGTAFDITALREGEAERRRLEKQVLHAQKLESLGVLAGGIAHDFNNILTTVIGNAGLARLRLPPDALALENLRQIELAAGRAADLAKQMLAYSGKGTFVVEAVDLNRLVEELEQMLRVSISKKARLRLDLARPLPAIDADPTQLRQVVMNLVINASEAIGDRDGAITVTTGSWHRTREELKDLWLDQDLADGTYVTLEVADTGCGMDRETQARIFDPFFSTKFTGRGLGMAAVLGIVRGHRGAIKLASEPGRGTTFRIFLPAGALPAPRPAERSPAGPWRGCGHVLLVDDEESVLSTGGEMLRALGFTVATAVDGREALARYRELRPGLVILDLTMPQMDGEQAFRELRAIDPGARVVISSGYDEQEVTRRFAGEGLAGFIQKPYTLETLRSTLSGICG